MGKSQSLSNNYLSAYISRNDFLSIFHSFGAMCVHERYERDIHRVSIFLTIRRYNMLTPSSIHFFSLLYINEKIYTRTVKPKLHFIVVGTFDSFLAGLGRNRMYSACCSARKAVKTRSAKQTRSFQSLLS